MEEETKLRIINELLTAKNATVCIYNFKKEILQYRQNGKIFQCYIIWHEAKPLFINNKEIKKLSMV